MLALLTFQKLLKLEFMALALYWDRVDSDYRQALAYDYDVCPSPHERAFYRHFLTNCQFEIGSIDGTFGCSYFWDLFEAFQPKLTRSLVALNLLSLAVVFNAVWQIIGGNSIKFNSNKLKKVSDQYFRIEACFWLAYLDLSN